MPDLPLFPVKTDSHHAINQSFQEAVPFPEYEFSGHTSQGHVDLTADWKCFYQYLGFVGG